MMMVTANIPERGQGQAPTEHELATPALIISISQVRLCLPAPSLPGLEPSLCLPELEAAAFLLHGTREVSRVWKESGVLGSGCEVRAAQA